MKKSIKPPPVNINLLEKVMNNIFRKKGYDILIKITPLYPSDKSLYEVLIKIFIPPKHPVVMINIDIKEWDELRILVTRYLIDVLEIMGYDKSSLKNVCLWISLEGGTILNPIITTKGLIEPGQD